MLPPESPFRTQDAARLEVWIPAPSAWQRLCPNEVPADRVLGALRSYLDQPDTRALLWRLEEAEEYPAEVLAGMRERGLMTLFAPAPDPDPDGLPADHRVTAWHLGALNAMNARREQSMAVTVSVNALGLLPAWVAANPEQMARINQLVAAGTFSSLLLSELAHGSNLLCNEAQAERGIVDGDGVFTAVADDAPCTHYRLSGEKDLINGATHHGLLFTFLRTRNLQRRGTDIQPLQARADFSMFWLERGEGMEALPRWRTLPARGADISGVRFCDVVVPANHLLGREHGGMSLAQKTLILSRGGVASLAAGCLNRARDLALSYAHRRANYGKTIHTLGAIADHLVRLEALDRIVSAVAVRTTAMLNGVALGAAFYTAVAKAVACELAEEGVREAQRVLGARALLHDAPFARLMREVPLYGVFDGTSHVMLQELSHKLALEAQRAGGGAAVVEDTIGRMNAIYLTPPQPLQANLTRRHERLLLPLEQHLRALAQLGGDGAFDLTPAVAACDSLFALVRAAGTSGCWNDDQGLRLDAAQLLAYLEALVATVELCDPDRRPALGLPPLRGGEVALDRPVYGFAVRLLCAKVTDGLRDLTRRGELGAVAALDAVDGALAVGQRELAARCRAALCP